MQSVLNIMTMKGLMSDTPQAGGVPKKMKKKIWNNEYINLSHLLNTAPQQEEYTLGFCNTVEPPMSSHLRLKSTFAVSQGWLLIAGSTVIGKAIHNQPQELGGWQIMKYQPVDFGFSYICCNSSAANNVSRASIAQIYVIVRDLSKQGGDSSIKLFASNMKIINC